MNYKASSIKSIEYKKTDFALSGFRVDRPSGWKSLFVKMGILSSTVGRYKTVGVIELLIHMDDGVSLTLCIPSGTITDLASSPWVLQPLLKKSNPGYDLAFVVHDDGYSRNELCHSDIRLPREVWDKIMLMILKHKGMVSWKRHGAYRTVRASGWLVWNEYRKAEQT